MPVNVDYSDVDYNLASVLIIGSADFGCVDLQRHLSSDYPDVQLEILRTDSGEGTPAEILSAAGALATTHFTHLFLLFEPGSSEEEKAWQACFETLLDMAAAMGSTIVFMRKAAEEPKYRVRFSEYLDNYLTPAYEVLDDLGPEATVACGPALAALAMGHEQESLRLSKIHSQY